MPRSAARTGALTTFTTWSTRSWNVPFSAAAVRSRVSNCESGPCAATVIFRGRPVASFTEIRPSCAASGMNGPSTSRSAWSTTGMLTAFVTMPAVEGSDDLLGDDDARAVLRLVGRGGEVRRDDDLVEPEQRPVVGLAREDVERGAGELPGRDRLRERLLVDERAARGVHEPGAVAHVRDRLAVDQAARLVGERRVERDDVGRGEQLLHRLRLLDAEVAEAVDADEGVVSDDRHPEPERAARNLLADAPEADHAERLPGDLDPAPAGALPPAVLERGVGLRDVPREREDQTDRLLGGRDDRRLRRVRDDDPAARRGGDVDVVDPDARRGRSP